MKKLFLVCNAHLDPVWLWDWQEGATAAVATFRTAADICEESDGFVFCHNEALLYEWVEEYEPELFQRIKKLVAAGKWHIIGGWYLQPDCNLPSGESILRQIIVGRQFFQKHFGVEPTVAVNFDTFGHSKGLVQILKQCGYEGYLFMRPEKERMDLPARNFRWKGFDGSEILAHRLDRSYRSFMGQAVEDVKQWVNDEQNDEISLFTWGIGNHGGGPSRIDVQGLDAWIAENPDLQPQHSTPEAFFRALEEQDTEYPVFEEDLRPVFVGCYTSQARLKRLHRQLENRLFAAEKLLSAAAAQGLTEYPSEELRKVEKDLLFSQFHDILPGTNIMEAEEASIASLSGGLATLTKLQMKGAMALLGGQEKARPEETPVFIYNPHPYPVSGCFTFEIMPSDQNWSQEVTNTVTVRRNGVVIPSQEEKASLNMNLDWRKRITVYATLEASSMNRFDCSFALEPSKQEEKITFPKEDILFDNGAMQVRINVKTGLVDTYTVDGKDYLQPGAFAPLACGDDPDPWHMGSTHYGGVVGEFRLVEEKQVSRYSDNAIITAPAVRIVENGPIRMKVEAELIWNNSRIIQTYVLPKKGTSFEVHQHIIWNEADTILKWKIPASIAGQYIGQGMFGSGMLPQDGTEAVSQKWCGLFGDENALTVANDGVYGSHCEGSTVYLSLLRSPGYATHPIDDRKLIHEERFIPRMDQGVHNLRFAVCGGRNEERRSRVDFEAQVLNEAPVIFSAFPSGSGTLPKKILEVSDPGVQLSALYYDDTKCAYIVRLWNALDCTSKVDVALPLWNTKQEITLKPFRFSTYRISAAGELEETDIY